MKFWGDVKKELRSEGIWLTAEQVRVFVQFAQSAQRYGYLPNQSELELLQRLEKRCKELKE